MRTHHHAGSHHPVHGQRPGAPHNTGPRHRVGRLPRWQRITSHLIFGLCALSGLAYLLKHELGWPDLDFAARPLLVTHGISAALALMAFGAVMPVHIRAAWNARRNLSSGILMLAVMAILALTGLGLYYGSEEQHELFLWGHWLLGGAAFMAMPLHLALGAKAVAGRRVKEKAQEREKEKRLRLPLDAAGRTL